MLYTSSTLFRVGSMLLLTLSTALNSIGVRANQKLTTDAPLHLRELKASKQAVPQQTFLAPVKLKSVAERKRQLYKDACRFAFLPSPENKKAVT